MKTVDDERLSDDDVVLVVEEMATGDRDGSAGEGEICDGVGGDCKSVKMKNDRQIKANVFFIGQGKITDEFKSSLLS